MNTIKKILLSTLIIAGGVGLTGCQMGVLELDIGMGFEEGAYVTSQ